MIARADIDMLAAKALAFLAEVGIKIEDDSVREILRKGGDAPTL